MTNHLYDLLSPFNTSYEIRLYGLRFKTPCHFLYYYCYGDNDNTRARIINASTVSELMSYNYQLQLITISDTEVKKYLYTLITYMFCVYIQFRECLLGIDTNSISNYVFINDSYFGATTYAYTKALKSFKNNINN